MNGRALYGTPPLPDTWEPPDELAKALARMAEPDPDRERICRRCDQPKFRHFEVVGTGLVCPRQVFTFEP